jgi:hypothetical protein
MHIQQKYLLSSVRSSGVKRKNCIKKHEMKNMAETRIVLQLIMDIQMFIAA